MLYCVTGILCCIVLDDKVGRQAVLKAMSCEIVASEREPLLDVVSNRDVSNSNCSDAANLGIVDRTSCVAETIYSPVTSSHLQVFKRRWYILVLFSLVSVSQSAIWNTWGPITPSAEIAFGWSLDDIALLTSWGCVMYVSSVMFFSWLMDVKGTLLFLRYQ